ncbi:MAG: acyl-CoA dehydrogenase family protein [Deltaproteobacteria bacterium]|nr:acyl-CoA dehydrogenase family protein [Deltaproteobacteria bacterium]MBW2415196.1 acyl-CoA dehydrogenase family protein [Deltaproteobacteria bacterium]
MIDFTLTQQDQKILDVVRERALICRNYARYYDEHEEEFAPAELPENEQFKDKHPFVLMRGSGENDTSFGVMSMLVSIGQTWGDYTVRLQQGAGGLGNASLGAVGTDEQKTKWGSMTLAMANTEPGCGSDSKAIITTAVLDGDEWVINGEKIFVTTGCRCDGVVVWATLDASKGRGAIKAFMIPKGVPGFEVTHKEKKLGIRADDTAAMVFTDCRIPRENLLGGNEEIVQKGGGGFKGLMGTFNMTRPGVAAIGLGMARAALDFTRDELAKEGIEVDYAASPSERSAVAQKLIEIEADLEAAELTVLHAVWLSTDGKPNNMEASIAKAKGGEVVRTATQRCLELLGGLGVSRDYLIEKWFRDVRITDIYEGTGQIQKLIIARQILEYSSAELS